MAARVPGAQRKLDAFNTAHERKKLPYYDVLGVPQTATQAEIVRAFRKLSLKLHPDKPGGSTELFQNLSKAYKCLSNEDSRRKYDDCGFDEDNIASDEVDQFVDAFFGEGARGIDGRSPDWNTGKIENYVRIDLSEVPLHMKDIVRIGLKYIVSLDHDFENVVLLQHSRVDILYLMVGIFTEGDLTQEIFESEESYPITYYDNPLQPGIAPRWSDQNVLGGRRKKKELPRRELNFEEFQRRQKYALAMLENAPADPMAALEEKYRSRMLAEAHQAACIADEKRRQAICGQDVYEDDAELDCSGYADFLTQNKNAQDGEAQLDCNGSKEAQLDGSCTDTSTTADSATGRDCNSLTEYESKGSERVLGFSSDGVLFVAKGGKVLRNEGPPRPSPEAAPSAEQEQKNLQCSQRLTSDSDGCSCFQFSLNDLWLLRKRLLN